jgi:hypothetical protein
MLLNLPVGVGLFSSLSAFPHIVSDATFFATSFSYLLFLLSTIYIKTKQRLMQQ